MRWVQEGVGGLVLQGFKVGGIRSFRSSGFRIVEVRGLWVVGFRGSSTGDRLVVNLDLARLGHPKLLQ